jgi:hypothetical protein
MHDARHGVPIQRFGSVRELEVDGERSVRYLVDPDTSSAQELPLDLLVVPRPDSKTLIVSLQGALGRDQTPPRFERYTSFQSRSENLVFVADTTLSPERDIFLAWYFGTAEDDLQTRTAAAIQEVARQLGATNIILTGSSGGGFASLVIGQKIQDSFALAFDPQVRPALWGVRSFPQNIYGKDLRWMDFEAAFPRRLSVVEVLKASHRFERFLVVQNSGDAHHVQDHLPGLLDFLGFGPHGGSTPDGRARVTLELHGDGHIPPSYDTVSHWLDTVVRQFAPPPSS